MRFNVRLCRTLQEVCDLVVEAPSEEELDDRLHEIYCFTEECVGFDWEQLKYADEQPDWHRVEGETDETPDIILDDDGPNLPERPPPPLPGPTQKKSHGLQSVEDFLRELREIRGLADGVDDADEQPQPEPSAN
jgi:hypothetical protein